MQLWEVCSFYSAAVCTPRPISFRTRQQTCTLPPPIFDPTLLQNSLNQFPIIHYVAISGLMVLVQRKQMSPWLCGLLEPTCSWTCHRSSTSFFMSVIPLNCWLKFNMWCHLKTRLKFNIWYYFKIRQNLKCQRIKKELPHNSLCACNIECVPV